MYTGRSTWNTSRPLCVLFPDLIDDRPFGTDSIPAKTSAMHQSGDHSYDISFYNIFIIISKFLTKPVLVIPIPTA